MLERSEAGKYAKHKFFSQYNDIDIFVEDTAKESRKIFTEILRRVTAGSISIDSIFPIGPKATVIKRCNSDQGSRAKKAIYIVDGDYDIATAKAAPPLKRLYRLKRYCVENYLLDDDAVVAVLSDGSIDKDLESIARDLDMREWRNRVTPHLNYVTGALVVASVKCCDGLASVKINLADIRENDYDKIDAAKVEAFTQHYTRQIDEKHGPGTFADALKSITNNLGGVGIDFNIHSSGKSLILPLIKRRIERRMKLQIADFPLFKAKLASRCDVSELADLPASIS